MKLLGSDSRVRLADILGHELRNPLASAVASVSVSLEMSDTGDPRASYLEQAMRDLERVSTLLSSYLDYGRSGDLNSTEFDLVEVVSKLCARYQAHSGKVRFESTLNIARLRGDPILLERLVENLVENSLALGATDVELFIERDCNEIVFQVTDNGPGVSRELADTLFEPFVSGQSSTGLGLAIAKDVIEMHGGSITLVPTAIGAMFRVSLPAA